MLNSLRSDELANAAGLLKEELRRLDSLILSCADAHRVERAAHWRLTARPFAAAVTEKIKNHPNIEVVYGEVTEIPEGRVVIASGPLTSDTLFDAIHAKVGGDFLHFYDAVAPIVTAESIDMDSAYEGVPLRQGHRGLHQLPVLPRGVRGILERTDHRRGSAGARRLRGLKVFEGCMPIEVNARRGFDTLRFGILKPIGLPDPKTGKDPYAVLQLRRDNANGTLYNLVGCQTHLKFGEQKRVFSMIPALKNAEFVRYGVMHRNTFLDSPRLLDATYALKSDPRIRFAGQMTGVEGYVESTASGCGRRGNGHGRARQTDADTRPPDRHRSTGDLYFRPYGRKIPADERKTFGIIEPLGYKIKGKREKNIKISERALEQIENWKGEL